MWLVNVHVFESPSDIVHEQSPDSSTSMFILNGGITSGTLLLSSTLYEPVPKVTTSPLLEPGNVDGDGLFQITVNSKFCG